MTGTDGDRPPRGVPATNHQSLYFEYFPRRKHCISYYAAVRVLSFSVVKTCLDMALPTPTSPGQGRHETPIRVTRGHSCTLCSQKKIRCDGERPCSSCVKSRVSCFSKTPQSHPYKVTKYDEKTAERSRRAKDAFARHVIPREGSSGLEQRG